MKRHGVSRGTVRRTARGDHRLEPGKPARRLDAPGSRVIREPPGCSGLGPASVEEGRLLGLAAGTTVARWLRLRLLGERPVMVERPTDPEDLGQVIAGIDGDHRSVTEELSEHGCLFAWASHTIDARAATTEDSTLLTIRRGAHSCGPGG